VREAQGEDAFNASVAWVERLRWAKAQGMSPLQALRHWTGAPEDRRAGAVERGTEREAGSLAELEEVAAEKRPGPPPGPAAQRNHRSCALSRQAGASDRSGYLAAGAFAVIVRALADGAGLAEGLADALVFLRDWPGHEETTAALTAACDAAAAGQPGPEVVQRLGEGWVAEEALAIAVYAALAFPGAGQARDALLLAVNHSGDSDSTGSICGNLVGAWHGREALPED
jgi:hypothetical protein